MLSLYTLTEADFVGLTENQFGVLPIHPHNLVSRQISDLDNIAQGNGVVLVPKTYQEILKTSKTYQELNRGYIERLKDSVIGNRLNQYKYYKL